MVEQGSIIAWDEAFEGLWWRLIKSGCRFLDRNQL